MQAAAAQAAKVLIVRRKTNPVHSYDIAWLYAVGGNKEEAFQWLNIAVQEHDDALVLGLKTDLSLDSLRSDPRYADLLRRIGLPQ